MRLVDADKLKISYDGHFVGVAKNDLDNAPTVEAEPIIHGHWIFDYFEEIIQEHIYHCSICGSESFYETPYCPNCGAKMESGVGE